MGAPVISELAVVEVSFDFIQVSWRTDIPASSQVLLIDDTTGETTVIEVSAELLTAHMVFINNLKPNTQYTIVVIATADGKVSTSIPFSVSTIE